MSRASVAQDIAIQIYYDDLITDDILASAAHLFSNHYGLWGPQGPKPGERVRMSTSKLQRDCLPTSEGTHSILVRAVRDDLPIAHALACTWCLLIDDRIHQICWVSQLVVHGEHREQSIATRLLSTLAEVVAKRSSTEPTLFGILSSHPASIRAFLRALSDGIEHSTSTLNTTQKYAIPVLTSSPIDYVRNAQLRGTLFDPTLAGGSISSAFTAFYVDHFEPLNALKRVMNEAERGRASWKFGSLAPGREFLCIVGATKMDA